MKKNNTEYVKVVDILIFNDKGQLALQKRALNDDSFPGHWDFSVGGHVDDGEEIEAAAHREIYEELGVKGKIEFISKEYFEYLGWKGERKKMEANIFKMKHNGPFKIDPKEVEEVKFFDITEVQRMIDRGEKFHPEFNLAAKLVI